MRLKIIFRYDGTNFYGYQIQKKSEERSVQQVMQDTLSSFFNEKIKIVASGRTDRGVHALAQVAHFDVTSCRYDKKRLLYSLNRLLPCDVKLMDIEEVPESFHARFNVKRKTYRYLINMGLPDPLMAHYRYEISRKLDIDLIREGMKLFLGEHNFQNFCTNQEVDDFVRTIFSFELIQDNDLLTFNIVGTGFKRYMVRMIIGALIKLGLHQINIDLIIDALDDSKKRHTLSFKAPAEGLYLVNVEY